MRRIGSGHNARQEITVAGQLLAHLESNAIGFDQFSLTHRAPRRLARRRAEHPLQRPHRLERLLVGVGLNWGRVLDRRDLTIRPNPD